MTWRASSLIATIFISALTFAQSTAPPAAKDASLAELVQQLSAQVTELRGAVTELRVESSRYRQETQELRQQLERLTAAQANGASSSSLQDPGTQADGPPSEDRLQQLEDSLSLLSGKVSDQYQTKVESGSKYRVRLSGILLLNMFGNSSPVDSADVPFQAVPTVVGASQGSFGGTLRQSQLRFEVFGPRLGGARTSGSIDMDFAGGFPDTDNGVTIGLARLRTATMNMDWGRTSLIAGQDAPFISPLSPTSLATLAQPALSYAGNLWTWIPQIRIEHRLPAGGGQFSLQAGILDPLSGEEPPLQYLRVPQAGEASRAPAFATRIGWSSRRNDDHAATVGIGGFYSRQNWRFDRTVDAWAATGDWSLPLGSLLTLTGEFYRGRALGGLGGGVDHSAVFFGPENLPTSAAQGVDTLGGWAQIKYRPTNRLEFNVAAGQDDAFASEFRDAALGTTIYDREAVRNRSALVNFIYRPRSNLLLSTEYRRIDTYRLDGSRRSADHVNLAVGVLF